MSENVLLLWHYLQNVILEIEYLQILWTNIN